MFLLIFFLWWSKQWAQCHIFITFAHQDRRCKSAYLHFSANVVQIKMTKFASYLHTWQTRVNPFVRGGEGLTLETSAKKLTVACKLSIFRSCEGARKKIWTLWFSDINNAERGWNIASKSEKTREWCPTSKGESGESRDTNDQTSTWVFGDKDGHGNNSSRGR